MKLPSLCPFCGYAGTDVDPVRDRDPAVPGAGDVSICVGCGEIAIFAAGGRILRKPTAAEAAELAASPSIRRLKRSWRKMVRELGRPDGGYHGSGNA